MPNTDAPEPLSLDGDALDPIGGGGALIGYVRLSTRDQNLDRQLHALKAAGRKRVLADGKPAEFIGELIVDGTHEGLAAARARGPRLGRPPAMTAEQIRQARALLTRPDESVPSVARLLGMSRTMSYKYVPELGHTSIIR